jgi:hypothetical protein
MVVSLDHWLKPVKGRGPTVDQRYDLKAFSSFTGSVFSSGASSTLLIATPERC